MNREELFNIVKERPRTTVILKDGSKRRLVVFNDILYALAKGRRNYGLPIEAEVIERIVGSKTKKSDDEMEFNLIQKFRKQALKATHTNDFIAKCIALPESMNQWIADGKKSAYDYSITTGCRITGDLVSIETIAKKIMNDESFKRAIANKDNYKTGRFEFNGYDGSIELRKNDDGTFQGWFSKEFRNCGNGYYYLLINDKYFIGYDVD